MCVTKENAKLIPLELLNEAIELFDEYYNRKAIRPFTEQDAKYVVRMEKNGEINEAIRVYRRAFHIVRKEFETERIEIASYSKLGDRPGFSHFDNNVYTFNKRLSLDVEMDDDDTYTPYRQRMCFYDPCPSGYFFKGLYLEETKHYLVQTEYEFLSFIQWKYVRNTLCDYFFRGINVRHDTFLTLPVLRRYIEYIIFLVIFAKHKVKDNEEYIASILVKEFFEDPDILSTGVFSRTMYEYTFDRNKVPFFTESLWRRQYICFVDGYEKQLTEFKRIEQDFLDVEYLRHKKRRANFCSVCDYGKSKYDKPC